jgi:hypothetical protein
MEETGRAMVRWTRAVGVFTALLFVVGALQLWDLCETNNFNRRALVAIQAPFVFVKATPFLVAVGPNKEIYWRMMQIWENSGNTAPSELFVDIFCYPSASTVSNPWAFRATESITRWRRTLGPKQDIGGGFCQYPSADIIKVQRGDLHLYITARATYGDKFNPTYTHVTEYCSELVEITGDANAASQMIALNSPCVSHNCTDEECKAQ